MKEDIRLYSIEGAEPTEWIVEMHEPHGDGVAHMNIFKGGNAKERAISFAELIYGFYKEVEPRINEEEEEDERKEDWKMFSFFLASA